MGLFSSDCAYCGHDGADEDCNGCGMPMHVKCARREGDLQVTEVGGGLLSSGTTRFKWHCPNCGRKVEGTM